MIHIYLMDLKGRPRLLFNQPAPVKEPTQAHGWMAVFSAVCTLPEGKELSVKFKTEYGRMATAILVNKDNTIDILPDENINLYMYARDIIPEDNFMKL